MLWFAGSRVHYVFATFSIIEGRGHCLDTLYGFGLSVYECIAVVGLRCVVQVGLWVRVS